MTVTLEATPTPATASIRLVLSGLPTDDAVTITRVDANGSLPVRLFPDQVPSDGLLVISDFEPALVGDVRYEAFQGGTPVASATANLALIASWVSSPQKPQLYASVDMVTRVEITAESSSVVHKIVGRKDPVVTTGILQSRSGGMSLYVEDYASVKSLLSLADEDVLLFRQAAHAGLDGYFTVTGVRSDSVAFPGANAGWEISLDMVGVVWPEAPLLGALGWNYTTVSEDYPTYATLAAEFATYTDLLVGV